MHITWTYIAPWMLSWVTVSSQFLPAHRYGLVLCRSRRCDSSNHLKDSFYLKGGRAWKSVENLKTVKSKCDLWVGPRHWNSLSSPWNYKLPWGQTSLSETLGELVKIDFCACAPTGSNSLGLKRGPGIFFFIRFQVSTADSGLWPTLRTGSAGLPGGPSEQAVH